MKSLKPKNVFINVGAVIIVLITLFFMDYMDSTGHSDMRMIRTYIKKLGYPELSQQTALVKTDIYGVYHSSLPITDEESGEEIRLWKVYQVGFTVPFMRTIVEPYVNTENHTTLSQ